MTSSHTNRVERSIVSAKAAVMVYDDAIRQWRHSVTSLAQPGISKVHIYYHSVNNTYRVVGRDTVDQQVTVNVFLTSSTRYHQATPTFHQWRDVPVDETIYGLNFTSAQSADQFAAVLLDTVRALKSSICSTTPDVIQSATNSCSNGRPALVTSPTQQQQQQQQQQVEAMTFLNRRTSADNSNHVTSDVMQQQQQQQQPQDGDDKMTVTSSTTDVIMTQNISSLDTESSKPCHVNNDRVNGLMDEKMEADGDRVMTSQTAAAATTTTTTTTRIGDDAVTENDFSELFAAIESQLMSSVIALNDVPPQTAIELTLTSAPSGQTDVVATTTTPTTAAAVTATTTTTITDTGDTGCLMESRTDNTTTTLAAVTTVTSSSNNSTSNSIKATDLSSSTPTTTTTTTKSTTLPAVPAKPKVGLRTLTGRQLSTTVRPDRPDKPAAAAVAGGERFVTKVDLESVKIELLAVMRSELQQLTDDVMKALQHTDL